MIGDVIFTMSEKGFLTKGSVWGQRLRDHIQEDNQPFTHGGIMLGQCLVLHAMPDQHVTHDLTHKLLSNSQSYRVLRSIEINQQLEKSDRIYGRELSRIFFQGLIVMDDIQKKYNRMSAFKKNLLMAG